MFKRLNIFNNIGMNKISPDKELETGSKISTGQKKEKITQYAIRIPSVKSNLPKKNSNKIIEKQSCCSHLCSSLPLICKNLKLKLQDDLLLGEEHTKKISEGFVTPENKKIFKLSSDEKTEIVLDDPKFGMFSLFKYHLRRGYLNKELKKSNRVYCSHIFSLLFALPIIVFISQWVLYISLLSHEASIFDGQYCPNKATIYSKFMMFGIGLIYFIKSFCCFLFQRPLHFYVPRKLL